MATFSKMKIAQLPKCKCQAAWSRDCGCARSFRMGRRNSSQVLLAVGSARLWRGSKACGVDRHYVLWHGRADWILAILLLDFLVCVTESTIFVGRAEASPHVERLFSDLAAVSCAGLLITAGERRPQRGNLSRSAGGRMLHRVWALKAWRESAREHAGLLLIPASTKARPLWPRTKHL
ncbi:unnamed protein product [Polarella glacialis]|uniref:Uncharacterized protein n=1 Tax=Polarella glacialis TaxID=89957 RepID=A0A813K1C7_POLGL|nr:unnamed protein product [Polarella glacialis]